MSNSLSTNRTQEVVKSHKIPLSLVFSKLDKSSALTDSSEDMLPKVLTSFLAILWMHSSILTSFLNCVTQNCTQYSKRGWTNAVCDRIMTSFDWPVLNASQNTFCLLSCQGTLLAHNEPTSQLPHIPSCSTALQPIFLYGLTSAREIIMLSFSTWIQEEFLIQPSWSSALLTWFMTQ